jgi:methyl-accepting chemotaxis protein
VYPSQCLLLSVYRNADGSQATKDVRTGQDALFEVFERIEAFFERLEIYPKAAFNQEMVEAITKIMVEVLNVLGIATKEIRQGRTSKLLLYKLLPLIERLSEKYLKKLIGRTDIEDALKRLDRLTQEEARMAAAQVLKVANTVDDRVQGIADTMLGVDHRVAGIDDRVADVGDRLKDVDEQVKCANEQVTGVDDRVKDVSDQVKGVNDRITDVDDKIAAIVDGA